MPRLSLAATLLLFAGLASPGCAPGRALTADDYRARIPALEARASRGPHDATALRDLGEAHAQTGRYAEALGPLMRAHGLDAADPKTSYYLGLAYEGLGRRDSALAALGGWADAPPRSPWRRLMAGRHGGLQRAMLREELAALVAAEDSLAAVGPADVTDAVAVFPFAYRGGDPRWAPLGRGLAEMITVDLAAVPGVRVVERVRLQALLDEMALGAGGAFDPATAPRAGRLLRSGQIVGGGLDARGGRLSADVALWAWPSGQAPAFTPHEGPMDELFRVEKEIAFGLVEDLGIELTLAQRALIERVPTRNLQAFLAYSRGLVDEDAGRYAEAAAEYREAVRLDPDFVEAAERAEAADAVAASGGGLDAALRAARVESAAPGGNDLVGSRIELLNASLGAQVVPGEESREPSSEVPLGPGGDPPIPDPPLPPPAGAP